MPVTRVSDVVVPEIFLPAVREFDETKSALLASGAVVRSPFLDNFLAGGGLGVNVPTVRTLEDTDPNVSNDDPDDFATPEKLSMGSQYTVRRSLNKAWATMDLAAALASIDPITEIARMVGAYRQKAMQRAVIACIRGVIADNIAAPDADEHVQGDMIYDVSVDGAGAPVAYTPGITTFEGKHVIRGKLTAGDSMEDLSLMFMHSVVHASAQEKNLIQFNRESDATRFGTYMGMTIIVDDGLPQSNGVFDTIIMGPGAIQMGVGAPLNPLEYDRVPLSGNGGGQDHLINRWEQAIHPVGYAMTGNFPDGGPSVATLADGTTWKRVYGDRKQIKFAVVRTREFAAA